LHGHHFMYISLGHGHLCPGHDTSQYTLQLTSSPAPNCLQSAVVQGLGDAISSQQARMWASLPHLPSYLPQIPPHQSSCCHSDGRSNASTFYIDRVAAWWLIEEELPNFRAREKGAISWEAHCNFTSRRRRYPENFLKVASQSLLFQVSQQRTASAKS
jgi:hypothetical protein